uniref:Uncharacterized protein n=1 Tax=Tetranychus urticae TaxID=32264 RepID=T1K298_TETUR
MIEKLSQYRFHQRMEINLINTQ